MTRQIKRAFVRHYSDTRQVKAYVEWTDGSRTEGDATTSATLATAPISTHMRQLFARALRDGLPIGKESW